MSLSAQDFAYMAPTTIDETITALGEAASKGARCQVLAGGTDLLVQLRSADPDPRTILDIKAVPETNRVGISDKGVFIGSAVSAATITHHEGLKAILPGLVESVYLIGSTQIQGRATLVGNLCNASPAGDTIPALIANQASCDIRGSNGARSLPVEEFVVGVQSNALEAGEFVVGVRMPHPGARTADAYLRFIPRTEMDIAVAGAGVSITLDEAGVCTAARVAIGAVAPTALVVPAAADALIGSRLEEASVAAAGRACTAASRPISDKRGTADYRRKVVAVLCERAIAAAAKRAAG
ncbi:MAG: FAD binding domain-containing protein [Gammaproteobacteria bacterium]|nr:FAD binding domain-containing protein [Gammaproteobacteria bacterium]